jgi:hypothetical protein
MQLLNEVMEHLRADEFDGFAGEGNIETFLYAVMNLFFEWMSPTGDLLDNKKHVNEESYVRNVHLGCFSDQGQYFITKKE